MISLKNYFLLFLLSLLCYSMSAQTTDTLAIIKKIWIERSPQDPGPPRLTFSSVDGNYQIGFGGYVNLVGLYDINGLQNIEDFIFDSRLIEKSSI